MILMHKDSVIGYPTSQPGSGDDICDSKRHYSICCTRKMTSTSVHYDFRIRTSFSMLCFGPTGSGKTVFIKNLLKNSEQCFDRVPDRIVYLYSQWQDGYEEILANNPAVEFRRDMPEVLGNETFFDKRKINLLILDDLASSVADSKEASDLFTRGVHHKSISCIHICQNMFQQGKSMRNLQLNAMYLVLFKNVRDINQIKLLAKQTGLSHLPAAYEKVTRTPFQPLIVDLKTDCPDYLRVRSHILPGEDMQIYMDQNKVPEICRRK